MERELTLLRQDSLCSLSSSTQELQKGLPELRDAGFKGQGHWNHSFSFLLTQCSQATRSLASRGPRGWVSTEEDLIWHSSPAEILLVLTGRSMMGKSLQLGPLPEQPKAAEAILCPIISIWRQRPDFGLGCTVRPCGWWPHRGWIMESLLSVIPLLPIYTCIPASLKMES